MTGMSHGFMGSRSQVRIAVYAMGAAACAYSQDGEWAYRCDCKFGADRRSSEQTGCPELRTFYGVIEVLTDEEWAMLIARAGGAPSGLFAATPDDLIARLQLADTAARQVEGALGQLRALLTFERDEPAAPWRVEKYGRKWVIAPLTDAAGLLMQEVGTPGLFERKRDAEAWLKLSLKDHLPRVAPGSGEECS